MPTVPREDLGQRAAGSPTCHGIGRYPWADHRSLRVGLTMGWFIAGASLGVLGRDAT